MDGEKRLGSRRISRRRVIGGLGVGATGLALMGCSRTQGSKNSAGSTAAQTQGSPKLGGQFHMRLSDDISSFDVSFAPKNETTESTFAYSRLLRFKYGPQVKYNSVTLQGELAERWEAPDGITYTFHMRPGVRFADLPPVNGRTLTSEDVKFSYEYETRTGQFQTLPRGKKLMPAQYNWMLEGLDSLQTPDPSTLVVRFKQPYVPFINYTATGALPIVPHEIYDADGDFSKRIVVSGPFQFDPTSTQRGTQWVWKKNLDYWDKGKPYLDEIVMLIIPDDSTSYAAFKTKQLDWLSGSKIAPSDAAQIKKDNPDAVAYSYLFFGAADLWMNQMPGKLLSDERLRQAISLSLNRDELIRISGGGQGAWALSGAFPDTFTQDEVKQILHYDPARAKQLVTQAGYPNGVDVEFQYQGATLGQAFDSMLELIQSQLKQGGINLQLKSLERQNAVVRRKAGDYIMTTTPNGSVEPDIDSNIYQQFFPASTGNNSRVNDPTLTAMVVAQRQEVDPAKRLDTIRQAVRYIAQHSLGLETFYATHTEIWHPALKNYAPNFGNPGGEGVPRVEQAWLER